LSARFASHCFQLNFLHSFIEFVPGKPNRRRRRLFAVERRICSHFHSNRSKLLLCRRFVESGPDSSGRRWFGTLVRGGGGGGGGGVGRGGRYDRSLHVLSISIAHSLLPVALIGDGLCIVSNRRVSSTCPLPVSNCRRRLARLVDPNTKRQLSVCLSLSLSLSLLRFKWTGTGESKTSSANGDQSASKLVALNSFGESHVFAAQIVRSFCFNLFSFRLLSAARFGRSCAILSCYVTSDDTLRRSLGPSSFDRNRAIVCRKMNQQNEARMEGDSWLDSIGKRTSQEWEGGAKQGLGSKC
jgi:hypothetical protein